MWTFAGLILLTCVLGYWLRRIRLALIGIGAIFEATVNRAAARTGEPRIAEDIDEELLR